MTGDTSINKLSGEERALFERAKQNHYVTIDEGDSTPNISPQDLFQDDYQI